MSATHLHNEMVRRASSARNAVARALERRQQGSRGANSPTPAEPPPATSSVFFTSPGAAYASVVAGTGQASLESRFASASPELPAAEAAADAAGGQAGGVTHEETGGDGTALLRDAPHLEGDIVMDVVGGGADNEDVVELQ